MRAFGRTVLAFGMAALTAPLFGQNHQSFRAEADGIREQARWRLGPLLLFPTLRISDVGYDDNVYLDGVDENPVSDYRANLSPEIKANMLLGGSLILSFTDNPEYMYYHKEKSRGGFGNSLSPGFKLLLLGRFALSGSYEYQKHFRQLSREVNLLTENVAKGYHGELFYETARMSSLGISADIREYSHENLDLEGSATSLARQLNREERSVHGELYYSLSPVRSFFLRAGYTEYSFESAEAGWRDSTSWQASGGIRFAATGRINGLLSLGYKELRPKERGRRSFSGVFGNTELSMRLGRITLRTVYSRDPMFSYLSDVYYYIEHRYGGGLSFYLNRLLRLDYNYYHELLDYPEPVPYQDVGGMRSIDRKDRGDLHSAGLTIRLVRSLGLGISANFADRRSTYPRISYKRFFVGGSLTYDF